jgi:hypothetical protein
VPLHVCFTSVLYGVDSGSIPLSVDDDESDAGITESATRGAIAVSGEEHEPDEAKKKKREDFEDLTSAKAQDLAQPLVSRSVACLPAGSPSVRRPFDK